MKDVKIPAKEKREKRLFVPVTPSEHKTIMLYCKKQKVTLADLIRYALKNTFDI